MRPRNPHSHQLYPETAGPGTSVPCTLDGGRLSTPVFSRAYIAYLNPALPAPLMFIRGFGPSLECLDPAPSGPSKCRNLEIFSSSLAGLIPRKGQQRNTTGGIRRLLCTIDKMNHLDDPDDTWHFGKLLFVTADPYAWKTAITHRSNNNTAWDCMSRVTSSYVLIH